MRALMGALAFTVATLSGACFSPNQPPCAFSCARGGRCPSGYSCASDGFCHRDDGQGECTLGTGDAGAIGDASTDGDAATSRDGEGS